MGDKRNTKFEYMYRDASNYKVWEDVVLEGLLTKDEKEAIQSKLYDGELFVPEAVGVDALQTREWELNEDDHPYHEFVSLSDTEEDADYGMPSAKEFLSKFMSMDREKWEKAAVQWNLGDAATGGLSI